MSDAIADNEMHRSPADIAARKGHECAPQRMLHDRQLGQHLTLIHLEQTFVHLHAGRIWSCTALREQYSLFSNRSQNPMWRN